MTRHGSETGLSVEQCPCSGNRLQPSPLPSSLGPTNMAHSANFPSNVQPVAMRYLYSFPFSIPLRIIICFYKVLLRNKGNKNTLIFQAIWFFFFQIMEESEPYQAENWISEPEDGDSCLVSGPDTSYTLNKTLGLSGFHFPLMQILCKICPQTSYVPRCLLLCKTPELGW